MVLKQVFTNVQRDLTIHTLKVLGKNVDVKLSALFRLDGVVEFVDGFKNRLTLLNLTLPIRISVELYEDLSDNSVAVKYVSGVYYVMFYFKFVGEQIKTTISGVLPSPIALKLPFRFMRYNLKDKTHNIVSAFQSGKRITVGFLDRKTKVPVNGISFDWSDISASATFDADNLTINVPATFSLDPSTILNVNYLYATQAEFQVKGFYAEGYFYEFVYNPSTGAMDGYSSSDGITWAYIGSLGYMAYPNAFSCFYEPKNKMIVYTYSYYVGDPTYTGYLRIGSGTLGSGGAITWHGEQVIKSAVWTEFESLTIDGWCNVGETQLDVEIAWNEYYDNGETFTCFPWVCHGVMFSNGSYLIDSWNGFPYKLSTINIYPQSYVVIVKHFYLTFKFGCIYSRITPPLVKHEIKAKFYDNGSWDLERTVESVTGSDGIMYTSAIAACQVLNSEAIEVVWLRKITAVDTYTEPTIENSVVNAGSASSLSKDLTVTSATLIMVGVAIRNASSQYVTGVTFNGVAGSYINATDNGTDVRVEWWYKQVTANNVYTIVVTLNASAKFVMIVTGVINSDFTFVSSGIAGSVV